MGLRDLGYVEGKNITIAFRSAETTNRLPEVAADLVRLNVDVIFATSSTEVEAARRATKTIPIVFATHADPESVGHVASLARPGGNITGLSMLLTELVAKQLEILKQALPHMTRVGVVLTLTAPSHRPASHAVAAAAQQRRRPDVLWTGSRGDVAAHHDLCRQDSQGRQARRPSCRAASQVRAGDQPEDGDGSRSDDPAIVTDA
jgi:hypothetical protein